MRSHGSVPGRTKRFLLQSIWIGSKAHPASYSVGTCGSFSKGKADGEWSYPFRISLTVSQSSLRYYKQGYLQTCQDMAGYFPLDCSRNPERNTSPQVLLACTITDLKAHHLHPLSLFVHTNQLHMTQVTSETGTGKERGGEVLYLIMMVAKSL